MKWLKRLFNKKTNFKHIDMKIYIKSGAKFFESFEFHLKHNIAAYRASFDMETETEEGATTRIFTNMHMLAERALVDALCETGTRRNVK